MAIAITLTLYREHNAAHAATVTIGSGMEARTMDKCKLSQTDHYTCQADAEGALITISRQWYEEAKERLATYEDIGSIKEFIALVQADTAQGWVSVKDRLPEPGEYLTWNGRQTEINTFGHHGGWMLLADPTHWMPLPEPPREGIRRRGSERDD